MHLVVIDTPVLYMMVFAVFFEGNWFNLLLIFLHNPPAYPHDHSLPASTSTFSLRAIQTFSTALNYCRELYTVIRARRKRGTSREQDDLTRNRREWSGKRDTAA